MPDELPGESAGPEILGRNSMTLEELNELEQKANAALDGPWWVEATGTGPTDNREVRAHVGEVNESPTVMIARVHPFNVAEGDLIAAANPAAIKELIHYARLGLQRDALSTWATEHAIPALDEFRLGHEHRADVKHIRVMGDTYGWCDFCQEKVSFGPGIAEQALEKLPGGESAR